MPAAPSVLGRGENKPWAARKMAPPLPRPALVVLLLLLAWALAPAAAAERSAGAARVVDGDTLDVAGIRVRLKGVAAPELQEPGGDEARDADSSTSLCHAHSVR